MRLLSQYTEYKSRMAGNNAMRTEPGGE